MTSPEEVLNERIKNVRQNIEGITKAKETLEKDGNGYFMLSEYNLKTENERLSELLTLQSILAIKPMTVEQSQGSIDIASGWKWALDEVRVLIEQGVGSGS